MYAVIETGGKQYRVEVGTELEVELLDAEPGQAVRLDRVLLVADGDDASVGQPLVADAAVEAEVVRRDRADKVIAFKYRPKARRRVKKGHRQELTVLRITDVVLGGRSAAETRRKADEDAKTERQRLEEAAARQAAADAELAARLAKRSTTPAETTTGETVEDAAPASKRSRAKATAESAAPAESAPPAESAAQEVAEASQGAIEEPAADEPGAGPGPAATASTESTSAPARKRTRAKKDE